MTLNVAVGLTWGSSTYKLKDVEASELSPTFEDSSSPPKFPVYFYESLNGRGPMKAFGQLNRDLKIDLEDSILAFSEYGYLPERKGHPQDWNFEAQDTLPGLYKFKIKLHRFYAIIVEINKINPAFLIVEHLIKSSTQQRGKKTERQKREEKSLEKRIKVFCDDHCLREDKK